MRAKELDINHEVAYVKDAQKRQGLMTSGRVSKAIVLETDVTVEVRVKKGKLVTQKHVRVQIGEENHLVPPSDLIMTWKQYQKRQEEARLAREQAYQERHDADQALQDKANNLAKELSRLGFEVGASNLPNYHDATQDPYESPHLGYFRFENKDMERLLALLQEKS